jgi:hypothetical protein
MDRRAKEFVHQLPTGRWFVGDFVARRGARTSPLRSAHLRSLVDRKASRPSG